MFKFSPSTGGFYLPEMHGDLIPSDAITVSEEEHSALLEAQSEGKTILFKDGKVVAEFVEAVLTWDSIRSIRDPLLRSSDWTQMPDSPLSSSKRKEWADYRQELRDVTESYSSPDEVIWPTAPE